MGGTGVLQDRTSQRTAQVASLSQAIINTEADLARFAQRPLREKARALFSAEQRERDDRYRDELRADLLMMRLRLRGLRNDEQGR